MNNDIDDFEVGMEVRALCDLGDPPSGDSPGGIYARRGTLLIVRGFGNPKYPPRIHVSHHDVLNQTFGVTPNEIEPTKLEEAKMNVLHVTTRAELLAALRSACHCDQLRIYWQRVGGVTELNYPKIDGAARYSGLGTLSTRRTNSERRNQQIRKHIRNVRALDKSHFIA